MSKAENKPYKLLPFNFRRLRGKVLLVNQVGQYEFVTNDEFKRLYNYDLKRKDNVFINLKSKHFVTDTSIETPVKMLSLKYRTKKSFLRNFTALHMIVVTLRCNHHCEYCHASIVSEDKHQYDLSIEAATKAVDLIFQSPSPSITIEFQGGEPLLNFDCIKHIVNYSKKKNELINKQLTFVICTNLYHINDEHLDFITKHNILISTSIDGPMIVHDAHRKLNLGGSSYEVVVKNIKKTQNAIGKDKVSALMTTTATSLRYMKEIVDEYVRLGFGYIALRALNPFGFASKYGMTSRTKGRIGYDVEDFVSAYKLTLDYIISINLKGTYMSEAFTTLLLSRMLTPFPTGFVDLQSPTGAGIGACIINYDGDVYPSDESRMLARLGDKKFSLGNVMNNTYNEIFRGELLKSIINSSIVEALPRCSTCAYQSYCGADPIRNYNESGHFISHRPSSEFCRKHMALFDYLMGLLDDNDKNVMDVFWSWITKRSLTEIREGVYPAKQEVASV